MSDFYGEGLVVSLSVASEHGPLHGQLSLLPDARGIVVIAQATPTLAAGAGTAVLAAHLRDAGVSTLSVQLIARQEEAFADVANNVPLLSKRLLDFLALLKRRMLLGSLPEQPFGIFAAGAMAPVAVRAAAWRDHEISALVCRGGLIDRAGMLYLRSLDASLLVLVDEGDAHTLSCCRRALREVSCHCELQLTAATEDADDGPARAAAQWFVSHLREKSPV